MKFLCKIGLHNWENINNYRYIEKRCKCCGKIILKHR